MAHPSSSFPPTPRTPGLEALDLDLALGGGDGGLGVRVGEAAAELVVLEGGGDGRADTLALAVVGTAGLLAAVVVGDAAARDELLVLAVADVLGAGDVGLDEGEGRDGDWEARLDSSSSFRGREGGLEGELTSQDGSESDADHFDGKSGE